jgi:hypothetical protein
MPKQYMAVNFAVLPAPHVWPGLHNGYVGGIGVIRVFSI